MPRFSGQVALVTGGARGMGRSHAVALAQHGADVAILDVARQIDGPAYPLATPEDLETTRTLVEAEGARCLLIQADVRDREGVDAGVRRTLEAFGRLDVLVANAGIACYGSAADLDPEAFDAVVTTNLTGVWNCCRAVLPHMVSRNYGRLVLISSGIIKSPMPNTVAYAAAKHGVVGIMRTIALEYVAQGITANVVAPYLVDTPIIQNEATRKLFVPEKPDPTYEDFRQRATEQSLNGVPWLDPAAISRAGLFLASPDASDITGTVLDVAGGSRR